MHTQIPAGLDRRYRTRCLALCVLLGTAAGEAFAANCTISTTPDPAVINVGQIIDFAGNVTGKSPKTYSWTFEGGSPASAGTADVSVSYANTGNFAAILDGTDGKGGTCTASITVQVNAVGNARPVAQNDEYNTQQDTVLSIAAPGVLSNDNDPDGDPMSATLVGNVLNGNLTLNADGSFVYAPDAGFTGTDSFTYTANDAGGASNAATVTIGVAAAGEVSINSTSANDTLPVLPVSEQPQTVNGNYTLLAINDLGMHCGDLDTRVSSILPPFNVIHAQVVERGINGLPRVMNEGEVELFYSASSNPDDPAIAKVASGGALSSVVNGEVYKTNFWDIASQAYGPFYPAGILDAFYDPNNPANNIDIGLPVPDVERLYLEDGELHASQQAMPGINSPYSSNDPQPFKEHIGTLPFFINFPFGYTADLNLFEAPGVPIAAFDDFGRENPYPLVRVEAHVGGATVASLDTVMPISGEASCQTCHADTADGGNGTAIENLTTVTPSLDDPAHGTVPNEVSVEWASDKNILALHDLKHDTDLQNATPVVCQTCHYTPALDLAQLGPLGPENDGPLVLNGVEVSPSTANGRDQIKHKSMSNVMHSHHGSVTDGNGNRLIPDMPSAIDGQGNRRDPALTRDILENSCYLCHPGKRTDCMRGAMANGGLVCQDCHGQMPDVGDDFTRDVSPANPGAFHLAADYYTNPDTPRVPWANEPGCGSCHTGYATDNLAGTAGTLVNPTDTLGNTDGIRLVSAYLANDPKATPIVPANKAFAENVVAEGIAADGNPKLYRVSTGHGGLFCEACHGSTHAEWPTANPAANDNVTANQLQGHSGYIAECQTCHEADDDSLPLGNNGPHGMHAIADIEPSNPDFWLDDRWNIQHRNYRRQGPGCEACHGQDLRGTVLSRTAEDRTVWCKDRKGSLPECAAGEEMAVIPKGTPVGCGMCHRQK
ncbi:MAG: Ig-like domain-containing protein [Candidatus Thiodiazotropha sp.]